MEKLICMYALIVAIISAACMFKFRVWGTGVQEFLLKSRDFGQPVQGSALSRLASKGMYLGPWSPHTPSWVSKEIPTTLKSCTCVALSPYRHMIIGMTKIQY